MAKKRDEIMQCMIHKLNELKSYKFVVIISRFKGKWLLSRHKGRNSWETQGGHIEKEEAPLDAAKRELFEESGAIEFSIKPVFDYWAGDEISGANGMVFFADIVKLGNMPESEMEEVNSFDKLPKDLTYPDITPKLFEHIENMGK
jgi:8-oxo-dGTP diphosphatase